MHYTVIWTVAAIIVQIIYSNYWELYLDAEILRSGNSQLLNNLEEGVFILCPGSSEIIFSNKAARKLTRNEQLPTHPSVAILEPDSTKRLKLSEKLFAPIDMTTLSGINSGRLQSSGKLHEKVTSTREYLTMSEVIESQKGAAEDDKIFVYKVRPK